MNRTNQITDKMASQIKAMKARGDKNQHIASWFGINQGRISDVCGVNAKPQYRTIAAENADIPPPGPYEFGGGGIAQLYRVVVETRRAWDQGDLKKARASFDRIYQSLGRPSEVDQFGDLLAEAFYDDRGVPR